MDRNYILAIVLTALVFIGYDSLIVGPKRAAYREAQAAAAAAPATTDQATTPLDGPVPDATMTRDAAIGQTSARLPIETPQLRGSLNLTGLALDDLTLTQYRATVKPDSANIVLLSPQGVIGAQYLRAGLFVDGARDDNVIWVAPANARLTPTTPVTLTRTPREGVTHRVTLSVDDQFMFTVTHAIDNKSGQPVDVQAYGGAFQNGVPSDLQNFMILYEGPLSVVGNQSFERKYTNIIKKGKIEEVGTGGWVGITSKLWLSAAIPPQTAAFRATLDAQGAATPTFRSIYTLDRTTVAPGQTQEYQSYLFAGAKNVQVLRSYQRPVADGGLDIARFDWAVDWGNFFFLTRPIFNTLHFFAELTGNYGVAILLLTLVLKALTFPLANMSFKSMAGMKKVQPDMVRLKERYKDDQMKLQQEMMALYKKHKINPAAGCLPILAQMPIFYALYKTLFVTIETRHQPFLYIKDLSSQDPTSIFNLFGLIPFDPTSVPVIGAFLGLGVLPLLMGAGMYVQTKLNPPPPDPVQRQIFELMPFLFMFMFAPFAAGLVLYWAWNTILSVVQQYFIMKRHGAEVNLVENLRATFARKPSTANDNGPGR